MRQECGVSVKERLKQLFSEGKTPIELKKTYETEGYNGYSYTYIKSCHREWCKNNDISTDRRFERPIIEYNGETYFMINYPQLENYRISASGKILGLHNWKIINPSCNIGNGLMFVTLRLSDGKSTKKTMSVSRLVGLTFLPPKINNQILIHLDGNQNNNCVNNLKYIDTKFKLCCNLIKDFLNCFNGAGFYYQFFSDPSLKSETSFNDIGKNEDLPEFTAWKEISY